MLWATNLTQKHELALNAENVEPFFLLLASFFIHDVALFCVTFEINAPLSHAGISSCSKSLS